MELSVGWKGSLIIKVLDKKIVGPERGSPTSLTRVIA